MGRYANAAALIESFENLPVEVVVEKRDRGLGKSLLGLLKNEDGYVGTSAADAIGISDTEVAVVKLISTLKDACVHAIRIVVENRIKVLRAVIVGMLGIFYGFLIFMTLQ